MKIVKDLIGGSKPETIDVWYNGDLAVDSVTRRYAGSFVKQMDVDDADHGWFFTFGGLASAMENVVGILAEDQPITGNYLPDHASLGTTLRKMYPIFPSTIIRGEYSKTDAAGAANTDTGATAVAGTATFTAAATGTADYTIGGWIYMVTGAAAGELHYVIDDDGSGVITTDTNWANAVAATDTFLFIWPACTNYIRYDATYTGIMSEIDNTACTKHIQGFMTYIQSPGIPLQPLDRNKHEGLVVTDARFFHDFVWCGLSDLAASGCALNVVRNQTAA